MHFRTSLKVMFCGIIVGLLIGTYGLNHEILWLGWTGIIIIALSVIQTAIFYRCPKCGTSLNVHGPAPVYCPHCGCNLDEFSMK